jgi:UDP-N-acetylglucosamine--N-acetylmuramyl-(pentapeptide) pyrophosphoryl-undecaprenol N-acetylglucosamine transferase
VPVVAHESDLTPGLANRLALPFVATLCVNFPDTHPPRFQGRVVHTGTPIRAALLAGDAGRGRAALGVAPGRPVLLVTGGSLGADRLNAVVREALPRLLERYEVVHVCGPGKLGGDPHRGYHEFEYVTDGWGDLLAAADVVVSRAGANTLYELLTLRKPNVLVPLSRRASRGDQIENAEYARAAGLSVVVVEEALTADSLCEAVTRVLADREALAARLAAFESPDAARLITDAVLAEARRAL